MDDSSLVQYNQYSIAGCYDNIQAGMVLGPVYIPLYYCGLAYGQTAMLSQMVISPSNELYQYDNCTNFTPTVLSGVFVRSWGVSGVCITLSSNRFSKVTFSNTHALTSIPGPNPGPNPNPFIGTGTASYSSPRTQVDTVFVMLMFFVMILLL